MEEGLDDGALVGEEFEVAGGKGVEVGGGREFDGAAGEVGDDLGEGVGAGDEVFVVGERLPAERRAGSMWKRALVGRSVRIAGCDVGREGVDGECWVGGFGRWR